jgi:hypothetical protein
MSLNPFEDDKLWNNTIAYNILSKLPTDLMNKVVDYVPEPKFKAQEFKAGFYSVKPKLLYTDKVRPYATSYYVDVLEYMPIYKDMKKTCIAYYWGYRCGSDLPPPSKYELINKRINKTDYIEIGDIKRITNKNLYFIDNPNFKEFTQPQRKLAFNDKKVIKPWKDYYEDELKELVSDEYTHHPR